MPGLGLQCEIQKHQTQSACRETNPPRGLYVSCDSIGSVVFDFFYTQIKS